MKIIKRHNYKLESDQLISVGLGEKAAKELCKMLNELSRRNIQLNKYYFQVVSDNFEIK